MGVRQEFDLHTFRFTYLLIYLLKAPPSQCWYTLWFVDCALEAASPVSFISPFQSPVHAYRKRCSVRQFLFYCWVKDSFRTLILQYGTNKCSLKISEGAKFGFKESTF